jgi:NDP-sugar pyrophosphorylase family protein
MAIFFPYLKIMQAVILAAGRGTRMGNLVSMCPKPLIPIRGVPILVHILNNLLGIVDEIILITGYQGDKISYYIGDVYRNIPITYIRLHEYNGTAAALNSAASYLTNRFLVLNGDDLYHKDDLELLLGHSLAFGIKVFKDTKLNYLNIVVDKNRNVIGFERISTETNLEEINVATGAYLLDTDIFNYDPVRLNNGEYGLPQTILQMAKERAIFGEIMAKWFPINYSKDIANAEIFLKEFYV